MTYSLKQLQDSFFDRILEKKGDALAQQVVGTDRVPVDVRLSIYTEGYRLRLIDALEDMYPALHTLVGDDSWDALTRHYISITPSRHFSIRYYGGSLANFLRTTAPYSEQPCIHEMAQFEWMLREVFDAPDAESVTLASMSAAGVVEWGDVLFTLHPTVRFLNLYWNVPGLWKAIEQASDPIAPVERSQAVTWMLWRSNLITYFRALEPMETRFFTGLNKHTFGDLCDDLAGHAAEQAAVIAAGFLRRAFDDGLIAALQIDNRADPSMD